MMFSNSSISLHICVFLTIICFSAQERHENFHDVLTEKWYEEEKEVCKNYGQANQRMNEKMVILFFFLFLVLILKLIWIIFEEVNEKTLKRKNKLINVDHN